MPCEETTHPTGARRGGTQRWAYLDQRIFVSQVLQNLDDLKNSREFTGVSNRHLPSLGSRDLRVDVGLQGWGGSWWSHVRVVWKQEAGALSLPEAHWVNNHSPVVRVRRSCDI